MQMDAALTGLTLLAALLLIGVTYGVILPYFWRPEDFFIKRFRSESNQRFTHRQLLFRAFVGCGLIHSGVHWLAFYLALGPVTELSPGVWIVPPILVIGLIVGAGTYVGLRFSRYRKLSPEERESMVADDTAVFVRRT